MKQTRLESIAESILNVGSGYLLSLGIWIWVVAPFWNLQVTMSDNLTITALYTAVSIVRGYLWRRLFNKGAFRKLLSGVQQCQNG